MENKVGRPTLPDIKIYYKATVIETLSTGERLEIDQQNRKENLEIDSFKYSQLILHKEEKATQCSKNSLQKMVL